MEEQRRISGKIGAPEAQSRVGVANHNVIPEEETKKLREGVEKLTLDNDVNCEDSTYGGHEIAFQLSCTEADVAEEDLAIRNLPGKFNAEVNNPKIVKYLVHDLKNDVANEINKQRNLKQCPALKNIDIKIHPHIRTLSTKLMQDLSQQVEQDPEVLVKGNLNFSNNKKFETAVNKFKTEMSDILSVAEDDPQISSAVDTCKKKIIHEFKYHKGKLITELTLGLSKPLLERRLTQNCYNEIDTLYTEVIKKRFEELIAKSDNSDEVLSKLKDELSHGLGIDEKTIEKLSQKYEVAAENIKEFLVYCKKQVQTKIDTVLNTQKDDLEKEHKKYSDKLERHLNKLGYTVLPEQNPERVFSSVIRSSISFNENFSSIKMSKNGSSLNEELQEEAPRSMIEVDEKDMPTVIKETVGNHLKQSVFKSGRNIHWYSSSERDSLKSEILNLKIKLTDEVENYGKPYDKTLRALGFDVNLSKLNFENPNTFALEFTLPDLDHVSYSNNLFKTERETVFAFKINLTPEARMLLDKEDVIEHFVDENGNSVSDKTGWRIQPQKAKDHEASTEDTDTSSIDRITSNIDESLEIATSKKVQPRTHKNVGRRMYEAFLLSIKVSPDSNDGFFRNTLNIFTQIPISAYIATFVAAGLTAGLLALSGVVGFIAVPIIAFGIPLVMLPAFLWVTRLFTNLSVGLTKNMTDVSLLENPRKRDRASAILSGFFWVVVVTPVALALNTVKGVFSFNSNYFTAARIDGTEKLVKEIRLLRVLEAITGLAVVAVYTALGIVAGLAITLSNAGALGFLAAAASPGLMTWMSPIIVLMATSPASLTLILTFTAIATAVLGSKILYDLFVMFIEPIVSKYRSDKKLETLSELAARLINGTNSRPPYLGLIGEEIFLPLIELLQNDYVEYETNVEGQQLFDEDGKPRIRRRWSDLTAGEKELLILKHAVAANYILDQYRTLLELKKVIQQARAENPETTIAEIIAQLNDSGDVHIGLYLQSVCPDAKDRNDPKILDLIENNLNRSIGMLMPFVSVKSQMIKEKGTEERALTSSEYRAKVKQAKSVEEFYNYVEIPTEHRRFLRAILKNPDELAEELKSASPRQYRLWQEKSRYGQWASDLFDREREEKALFLNYVAVVEGGDVEQSISKKIKLYLPGESKRLLEKFDREEIYDSKLVKELRKKHQDIKSMDGLREDLVAARDNGAQNIVWLQDPKFSKEMDMPTASYITKELVSFIDDEYKELSAELQDLQERLKDQEIDILSRKKMLQRLLSQNGNTVNGKTIKVQKQIDRLEQVFALLLHQASICEKIIHYDETLLKVCAKQERFLINPGNLVAGIEGLRSQYRQIHEKLEEVSLEGHFLSPIISHTSMLDESYKFIESRTTAISENTEVILETYQACSLHRISKEFLEAAMLPKNHEADQTNMRILKESEEQMLIKLERAKSTLDYLKNYCERHDTIDATAAQTILARYRDLLPLDADMSELLSDMLYGANGNTVLTLLIGYIDDIRSFPEEEYTQELALLLADEDIANFILALEHHITNDQQASSEIKSLVRVFKGLEKPASLIHYMQRYREFIEALQQEYPGLTIVSILQTSGTDKLEASVQKFPMEIQEELKAFIAEFSPRNNIIEFMRLLKGKYIERIDDFLKPDKIDEIKEYLENNVNQNSTYLRDLNSFIEMLRIVIMAKELKGETLTFNQLVGKVNEYEQEENKKLQPKINWQDSKNRLNEISAIATRMLKRATVQDILNIQETLELEKPNYRADIVGDINHINEKVDLLIEEIRFDKKCLEAAIPVHDSKNFEPEIKIHNPNLSVCRSRAPIQAPKLSNEMMKNIALQKQGQEDKLNYLLKRGDKFSNEVQQYKHDQEYMIPLEITERSLRQSVSSKQMKSINTEELNNRSMLDENEELNPLNNKKLIEDESKIYMEEIKKRVGNKSSLLTDIRLEDPIPKISWLERFKRIFIKRKLTEEEKSANAIRAENRIEYLMETYIDLQKAFHRLSNMNSDRLYDIMSGVAFKVSGKNYHLAKSHVEYYKTLYTTTQNNIEKIIRRMTRIALLLDQKNLNPNKEIDEALKYRVTVLKNIDTGTGFATHINFNNKKMHEEFKEFFGVNYPQFQRMIILAEIQEALDIPATDHLQLLQEIELDDENFPKIRKDQEVLREVEME